MDLDLLSVNTIRFLAVDAEKRASSGHPGLPKGVVLDGRLRVVIRGLAPGQPSPVWREPREV
jgi:Transketolase, thiamine diphosphate binding domain